MPSSQSSGEAPAVDIAGLCFQLVKRLILLRAPPFDDQTRDDTQTTANNNGRTAGLVSRLLAGEEKVGREPMTSTADTIGDGDQCSSLSTRSRYHSRLPRNMDVQTNEGARAKKDHREVSRASVEGGDHYNSADDREHDRCTNMPAMLQVATTGPGNTKRDEVGNDVRWCLNEVCDNL
jgi:hypothetical protein